MSWFGLLHFGCYEFLNKFCKKFRVGVWVICFINGFLCIIYEKSCTPIKCLFICLGLMQCINQLVLFFRFIWSLLFMLVHLKHLMVGYCHCNHKFYFKETFIFIVIFCLESLCTSFEERFHWVCVIFLLRGGVKNWLLVCYFLSLFIYIYLLNWLLWVFHNHILIYILYIHVGVDEMDTLPKQKRTNNENSTTLII